MILAGHYGWELVSPDRPPDWHDLLLMAQHLSEERVGRRARQHAGTTQAQESDRERRLRMYSE